MNQLAAFSYATSAMILFVYQEPLEGDYLGNDFTCAGSSVLTFVSISVAIITLLMAFITIILFRCDRCSSAPSIFRTTMLSMNFDSLVVTRSRAVDVAEQNRRPWYKRLWDWIRGMKQSRLYAAVGQDQPPDSLDNEESDEKLERSRSRSGLDRSRSRATTDIQMSSLREGKSRRSSSSEAGAGIDENEEDEKDQPRRRETK